MITYRINCKDYSKAIVDGAYEIQILDANGADVTPSIYSGIKYSILGNNQTFEFRDATPNVQYSFNILYDADFKNDINSIEHVVKSFNSSIQASSDIVLGNVYADTDMSDNTKVNIRFFDSLRLSDAKVLRYSIYDENSFSVDNEVSFVPALQTASDTSYYSFMLPDSITADGVYYISMQFLSKDGDILAETTIEYRLL